MAKKAYVKIEGLEKIIKILNRVDGGADNALLQAVKDGADIVENNMRQRVQKFKKNTKPGEIQKEIKIKSKYKNESKHSATAYVGPGGQNIDYAFHVEVGTKDSKAKPYARPSVDRNRKKIKQAIDNAIGKAVERALMN